MSLIELFESGGPVMWPLLVCSLVAVAISIERGVNLRRSRILDPAVVERVTGLVEGGRVDRALEACRQAPGIYTNIVRAGLEASVRGEWAAKEAVEDAGRHESRRLTRYLGALGTVVGVSPLLGLLGTVTGMIEVFKTIARVGTGQAEQLSNGISQALITTAAGLVIAIPSLVAYNYYQGRAESILTDLEAETLRALHGLYEGEGLEQSPRTRQRSAAVE